MLMNKRSRKSKTKNLRKKKVQSRRVKNKKSNRANSLPGKSRSKDRKNRTILRLSKSKHPKCHFKGKTNKSMKWVHNS